MSRYTDEQTHHIMSSVHSKNTNIEVALRKELWRQGYRYRKNVKTLPGNQILFLQNISWRFFVIVSFGMERIGKFCALN